MNSLSPSVFAENLSCCRESTQWASTDPQKSRRLRCRWCWQNREHTVSTHTSEPSAELCPEAFYCDALTITLTPDMHLSNLVWRHHIIAQLCLGDKKSRLRQTSCSQLLFFLTWTCYLQHPIKNFLALISTYYRNCWIFIWNQRLIAYFCWAPVCWVCVYSVWLQTSEPDRSVSVRHGENGCFRIGHAEPRQPGQQVDTGQQERFLCLYSTPLLNAWFWSVRRYPSIFYYTVRFIVMLSVL